jgi:hypothetical protein
LRAWKLWIYIFTNFSIEYAIMFKVDDNNRLKLKSFVVVIPILSPIIRLCLAYFVYVANVVVFNKLSLWSYQTTSCIYKLWSYGSNWWIQVVWTPSLFLKFFKTKGNYSWNCHNITTIVRVAIIGAMLCQLLDFKFKGENLAYRHVKMKT